uniref:60S ribosome subunit biogenesis protein NIP7 pre-PUA domain-containing protein n=1 Tax=Spermophilus dauricus TaxID=99837 RepID=A0A8C9QJ84_SPEDA
MRPLTEEETRVMFEKIAKYIGENLQLLVDRPDGTYCFRLHNDRVYYVSEKILKLAANISGDKLVSLGTCFGKFTKTHKFRMVVHPCNSNSSGGLGRRIKFKPSLSNLARSQTTR